MGSPGGGGGGGGGGWGGAGFCPPGGAGGGGWGVWLSVILDRRSVRGQAGNLEKMKRLGTRRRNDPTRGRAGWRAASGNASGRPKPPAAPDVFGCGLPREEVRPPADRD